MCNSFCAVSELQIKSTTTFVTCTRTNCYKKRTLSTMARTVSEQTRVRLRDPPGLLRIRSFVSGHRSYLKRGRLTPVSFSRTDKRPPTLVCRPSSSGHVVDCGVWYVSGFPCFRPGTLQVLKTLLDDTIDAAFAKAVEENQKRAASDPPTKLSHITAAHARFVAITTQNPATGSSLAPH